MSLWVLGRGIKDQSLKKEVLMRKVTFNIETYIFEIKSWDLINERIFE